jgi:hypothetical protein
MKTNSELIERLAGSAHPVRRLRPPLARLGVWFTMALAIILAGALIYGLRVDLMQRLAEPAFALRLAGSLATAALAGLAAFNLSLPDRSDLWLALPVPTLLLWLSTLGYGCVAGWVELQPEIVTPARGLACLFMVFATSVPVSLLTFGMLRHARWFRPGKTLAAATIAVTALAASFVALLHALEATILTIAWNVVAVVVSIVTCKLVGGRLLYPRRSVRPQEIK